MTEKDFRLLGASDAAAFVLDEHGHVVFWNAHLHTLTGWPAAELIGKKCATAFLDKNNPADAALRSGEACDEAFAVTHKDTRELRRVRFFASRTQWEGEPTLVVATLTDTGLALAAREVVRLEGAFQEGRLSERLDPSLHSGPAKELAVAFDNIVNVLLSTLERAMGIVDAFADGVIPEPVEGTFKGDYVRITDRMNRISELISKRGQDTLALVHAIQHGHLDVRVDATKYPGYHAKTFEVVNSLVDTLVRPLRTASDFIAAVACGEDLVRVEGEYKGDFAAVKDNINACVEILAALVAESDKLAAEAVQGRLSTRGDETVFRGTWAGIVKSFNDTLDAVIVPLHMAANTVDRISKGDIPPKISEPYRGDFNTIKNNLNTCIDAINALISDAAMLSKAAVQGNLSNRAEATKHQGDFRRIIQGVNDTLDAVIGPLNMAASHVDRIAKGDIPQQITASYNGDFNTLKNNLNTCVDAVNALVADVAMLSKTAVEGKLATRADASKHQGDFRRIIQGVNDTLDAVIGPLNMAVSYVERISKGDIPPPVSDAYQGDFNEVKGNLNSLIASLEEITELAQRIADGDLTVSVVPRSHVDTLLKAFGQMVDNLNVILRQARGVTEQVAGASREVADASQSLSQGATEQASALQEISSSMTELAAQTKQNAENASQANQLTGKAREGAMRGNEQMKEMVSAMSDIEEASKKISKIIKVIDEIAFQTNLLALNAAVEAARAGQHGKGFAVVAEEVRNLAARSAKAAEETTEMIEGSIRKVERGTEIAQKTSEALSSIFAQIGKVTELVAEIAAASTEQAQGIQQTTQGLGQIEIVTQRTSANAQQSATASHELSSQAKALQATISKFRLREERVAAAGLPPGITPEMLEMLKQLLARGALPGMGRPPAPPPQPARRPPVLQDPRKVISLDDADLGKF
ncbi:MAG: methyl-accepting chemotaxis protein [Myxococcales bacterium]